MNRLFLTFEGPRVGEDGLPVDAFTQTLTGMQDAMRLMVEHLGGRRPGPGQPPRWVREQSRIQLTAVRPGSLVAELAMPPPDGQLHLEDHTFQAFTAICNWDGSRDSTLPAAVTDRLYDIASALPGGVRLWLGNAETVRKTEVTRPPSAARSTVQREEALLYGWLKEVNWHKGTAQLHDYSGSYVRLRFGNEYAQNMLRLATQYVEIRGRGSFSQGGDWTTIGVEEITAARSLGEPLDVEKLQNDPNPKTFDSDNLVTASEPFDVDDFVRIIHVGRDEGRKE